MSKRCRLEVGDSCLSSSLCLPSGHSPPKMCSFLSVWRFLFFFVCPRTSALYQVLDFLPPGPSSITLLISSYSPALAITVVLTSQSFNCIAVTEKHA